MAGISIIYAYRNRDYKRIKASLDSIDSQLEDQLEVIFVDYGSAPEYSNPVRDILGNYEFANYYYLPTQKQLWNKSRALNFGVRNAVYERIFIADVDLFFLAGAIKKLKTLSVSKKFFLFSLAYLNKDESNEIYQTGSVDLSNKNFSRVGTVNGMLLTSKESLFKIYGYDEFYHFYGSEDVDVFSRLENAGFECQFTEQNFFLHIWHEGYQKRDKKKLSKEPRLSNALRINQQHYFFNKKQKIIKPSGQSSWGDIPVLPKDQKSRVFRIQNKAASVEYYLNEILYTNAGQLIIIEVTTDGYYNSLKYHLKNRLGKQTQRYISMENVNDYFLRTIIFHFRYHYYEYEISEDYKKIKFMIQL